MPLVDDQGRLFGRVNLVDAAIGSFIALLVPAAYATYLLFQPPAPTITSVEPAALTNVEERVAQGSRLFGKLKVRGTGFRPVMRATIGGTDAISFIFENPTSADVLYGAVAPGRHDLILYDGVREVARAPGSVTVDAQQAPGRAAVALVGTLLDLDAATAAGLKIGATYPPGGEVRAEILGLGPVDAGTLPVANRVFAPLGGRHQRRVLMRVNCDVDPNQPRECGIGKTVAAPAITYTVPGTNDALRVYIENVVPAEPPAAAQLRVRLLGIPEAIALVRVGDVDRPTLEVDGRGAIIRSVGARRDGTGDVTMWLSQEASSVLASTSRQEPVSSVEVTMSAGLDVSATERRYRGDGLRIGGPITFSTSEYTLRGIVLGIAVK